MPRANTTLRLGDTIRNGRRMAIIIIESRNWTALALESRAHSGAKACVHVTAFVPDREHGGQIESATTENSQCSNSFVRTIRD